MDWSYRRAAPRSESVSPGGVLRCATSAPPAARPGHRCFRRTSVGAGGAILPAGGAFSGRWRRAGAHPRRGQGLPGHGSRSSQVTRGDAALPICRRAVHPLGGGASAPCVDARSRNESYEADVDRSRSFSPATVAHSVSLRFTARGDPGPRVPHGEAARSGASLRCGIQCPANVMAASHRVSLAVSEFLRGALSRRRRPFQADAFVLTRGAPLARHPNCAAIQPFLDERPSGQKSQRGEVARGSAALVDGQRSSSTPPPRRRSPQPTSRRVPAQCGPDPGVRSKPLAAPAPSYKADSAR